MRAAHQLHLTTSATMMFGHIETLEERFEHLVWLREVQSEKPADANGFLAFIPWPFMDDGTLLRRVKNIRNSCTPMEYVRMIAICRIMLPNIPNISGIVAHCGQTGGADVPPCRCQRLRQHHD
jgi:cyclic dehypoxanthinyl futalosine synthase